MPFLTKTNKRKNPEKIHEIKTNLECSFSDNITYLKDTNNNSLNKKSRTEPNNSNDSNEIPAEIPTFQLKEKTIQDVLKEKEENLRRLKLVEHYKTKVFY